jgi:hypothetical protein
MNEGAGVHSLAALRDWYAALALFKSEAQNALTSVALTLQHAANWLVEQQHQWRREQRRAEDAVVQARTELRRKEYQDWMGKKPDTTVEQKALARAVARLEFVEERMAATRRWIQSLPGAIQDTYQGPSRSLSFFLDSELSRAMALLARQMGSLEHYVAMAAGPVTSLADEAPQGEATEKKS